MITIIISRYFHSLYHFNFILNLIRNINIRINEQIDNVFMKNIEIQNVFEIELIVNSIIVKNNATTCQKLHDFCLTCVLCLIEIEKNK